MKKIILFVTCLTFMNAKQIPSLLAYENLKASCIKKHNANSCISIGFLYEVSHLDTSSYLTVRTKYSFSNTLPIKTMDNFYNFSKKLNIIHSTSEALKMYEKSCMYKNSIGCNLSGICINDNKKRKHFFQPHVTN